jgi:Glycogen recognition site of AMP-activated protein kinase
VTFVRADRAPEPDDETLHRIAAELRRPVAFDAAIDAAALRAIRAGWPTAGRRRLRPWLGAAAAAALAASILLVVALHRGPAAGPSRAVLLRLVAPASSTVTVVGDFNDWNPSATPLRPGGAGEWTVRLRLPPGRYRYTFLVDGREWQRDPTEPPAPDDDYGAPMSVITVS